MRHCQLIDLTRSHELLRRDLRRRINDRAVAADRITQRVLLPVDLMRIVDEDWCRLLLNDVRVPHEK